MVSKIRRIGFKEQEIAFSLRFRNQSLKAGYAILCSGYSGCEIPIQHSSAVHMVNMQEFADYMVALAIFRT